MPGVILRAGSGADADFIAHARTDIPALLAALVAAEAALADVQRWLDAQPKYEPTEGRGTTAYRQRWRREHAAWLDSGPGLVRAALAAVRTGGAEGG